MAGEMMSLGELMGLRWSWQGPAQVREPGMELYYELRILELPEFFVAGQTREEVLAAAGPALRAFLGSYVEAGAMPPRPADRQVSWMVRATSPAARTVERAPANGEIILSVG